MTLLFWHPNWSVIWKVSPSPLLKTQEKDFHLSGRYCCSMLKFVWHILNEQLLRNWPHGGHLKQSTFSCNLVEYFNNKSLKCKRIWRNSWKTFLSIKNGMLHHCFGREFLSFLCSIFCVMLEINALLALQTWIYCLLAVQGMREAIRAVSSRRDGK